MSLHTTTASATPQTVPCAYAGSGPEPFAMIDEQAGLVVKLARILDEVLLGKESAHSLRLQDLEQRRGELQRRHQAAVIAMHPPCVWADELRWTLETLDRVAAGLFRAARRCHHSLAGPDEATGEIVAAIQKAAANLRQGYARLANGSPAAELDAEAALAGKEGLAGSRAGTSAGRGGALPGRASRLHELHGNLNDIARDLARAAAVLKGWSRQLAGGLPEWNAGADARALMSQRLGVN